MNIGADTSIFLSSSCPVDELQNTVTVLPTAEEFWKITSAVLPTDQRRVNQKPK